MTQDAKTGTTSAGSSMEVVARKPRPARAGKTELFFAVYVFAVFFGVMGAKFGAPVLEAAFFELALVAGLLTAWAHAGDRIARGRVFFAGRPVAEVADLDLDLAPRYRLEEEVIRLRGLADYYRRVAADAHEKQFAYEVLEPVVKRVAHRLETTALGRKSAGELSLELLRAAKDLRRMAGRV